MSQIKVDVLSHHGILGMKWGIRRFQPYPKGYKGDGKYTGPDAKKDFADNIKQLGESTTDLARSKAKTKVSVYGTNSPYVTKVFKNQDIDTANEIFKTNLSDEIDKIESSNTKLKSIREKMDDLIWKYETADPDTDDDYHILPDEAQRLKSIKEEAVKLMDDYVNELLGDNGDVMIQRIKAAVPLRKVATNGVARGLLYDPRDINIWGEEARHSDDELNHHGILGMKWGIRRFQKYPAGYSGDGKYVGPDGKPRQPTRREARRDRRYNELKAKIDKWLVDAVDSGDKKTLKRLKKTMTPKQYQSAYDALVNKGINDAVKSGNKDGLKKYKNDISKNEYKDAKTLAEFNDAVNRIDTKKMNKLVGKIKNEDIREAAQRIATMTELHNKKISAIKAESEMSAKISKVATTVNNVANLAGGIKKIYDVVSGIKDSVDKRARENEERNKKLAKEAVNERIEKIIKRGDVDAFEKYKTQMSNEQIEAFNKRIFLNNAEEINRAILTGDKEAKLKWAKVLPNANVETLNKATVKEVPNNNQNQNQNQNQNKNNNQNQNQSKKSEKNQNEAKAVDVAVQMIQTANTPVTKSSTADEIKGILDARTSVIFKDNPTMYINGQNAGKQYADTSYDWMLLNPSYVRH